jgi:hypothetical protein
LFFLPKKLKAEWACTLFWKAGALAFVYVSRKKQAKRQKQCYGSKHIFPSNALPFQSPYTNSKNEARRRKEVAKRA